MKNKNNKCMASVATSKYLPRALVMIESFVQNNPDCDVLLLVPDLSRAKIDSVKWPLDNMLKVLAIEDIDEELLQKMHRYFNAFEFCCAAKTFLLEYALFKCDYEKVVLLDPDLVCYTSFDGIWPALDDKDVVLTPHVNSPLPDDGCLPDDREFVGAGFVNGGFWLIRHTDMARRILLWMKMKVVHFGFFVPELNLYADQTWLSCLPWFFPDGVGICRVSGVNVAYWNLHERKLTYSDGKYLCNGEALVFFHFSGYDERKTESLTANTARRFDDETQHVLNGVLREYGGKIGKFATVLLGITPDNLCSEFDLRKRFEIYESVHGSKLKFAVTGRQQPFLWKFGTSLSKIVKNCI